MPITADQLKAMPFGYLTGGDLTAWCPPALLINAYTLDADTLQRACDTAYAEVTAALTNLYNISAEMAKTGTARSILCVKVTAIHAVSNALGNAQGISEKMMRDIDLARKDLLAMRTGQLQLPLQPPPSPVSENGQCLPWPAAVPKLVCSSFSNLG